MKDFRVATLEPNRDYGIVDMSCAVNLGDAWNDQSFNQWVLNFGGLFADQFLENATQIEIFNRRFAVASLLAPLI
jgi:hypothetical protein